MNSRELELRHLVAPLVRTYEPILANDNSTEAEINTAAAAVARANLYKAEARALGITLPSTVAELDRPVGEPVTRAGAEYGEAEYRPGVALRSNQRVSDDPRIEKSEARIGSFLLGAATDNWKGREAEKRAAMGEGTGSLGGYATNPDLSAQWLDLLRANQVVQQAGCQTVSMVDAQAPQLFWAKLTGDVTPQWLGELSPATPSAATLARITFVPSVITATVEASLELLQDSPFAEDILLTSLTQAMAVEIDRAALIGSGVSPIPQGVIGTGSGAGHNTPSANGDTIITAGAWGPLVAGYAAIQQSNATPTALIQNPRTAATYAGLVDTLGQPLKTPDVIAGLKHLTTTSLPITQTQGTATTCTSELLVRGQDIVEALWLDITFDITRVGVSGSSNNLLNRSVFIRAVQRMAVQCVRPSSAYYISGLLN